MTVVPHVRLRTAAALLFALAGTLLAADALTQPAAPVPPSPAAPGELAAPAAFGAIAAGPERSAALFAELGKVLTHPRCTNCHPAGDRPRQGDMARLHQPAVFRGADGHGLPAARCNACHGPANFESGRMPGHPAWHLAPIEMAWEGRTPGEICRQISDPARNGDRTLADLVSHIGDDTLVGWAWHPGPGRTPAPGTQAAAKALVEAWIASGAACPD